MKSNDTRKRVSNICSVRQLLYEIYEASSRRSSLRDREIGAIRTDVTMSPADLDRYRRHMSLDWTLEKMRRLMTFVAKFGLQDIQLIRDMVRDTLRLHPAFRVSPISDVLNSEPHSIPEYAFSDLASQDYESLPWSRDIEINRAGLLRCKENAVYCILVWYHFTRRKSERGEQAIAREHALEKELASTGEKLAVYQNENVGLMTRNRELERNIEAMIQSHRNEILNLEDNYESLRGQVRGYLGREISLLGDGLRALRRKPPKVHVMIDHAERVVDGLKSQIERLKGHSD